jgi:hypothetical protein
MLAQIWGGNKTSTVDDFNPYVIDKRPAAAAARRGRRARLSELVPLLKQWVPNGGKSE